MKILLTVFGVYNTLENVDDEVFKEIIDKIKQIKEINNDDVILISFCDNTAKLIENNNMVDLYYIDGSINEEYVNDLFSVFGDKVNTNIIKNKDEKIIQEIDNKINSVKKNTYKNNMSSN